MVTEPGHCAFATNKTLGKIFKISAFKVADIIRVRFERNRFYILLNITSNNVNSIKMPIINM